MCVGMVEVCHLYRRQLFCTLTNRYMNRKPAEVELHLKGRRYKTSLEKCECVSESEV